MQVVRLIVGGAAVVDGVERCTVMHDPAIYIRPYMYSSSIL